MLSGLREPLSEKSLYGIFPPGRTGKLAARPIDTLGCFFQYYSPLDAGFLGRAGLFSYRWVVRSAHGMGHGLRRLRDAVPENPA